MTETEKMMYDCFPLFAKGYEVGEYSGKEQMAQSILHFIHEYSFKEMEGISSMSTYEEEWLDDYYLERDVFCKLFIDAFKGSGIDLIQTIIDGWKGDRFNLFYHDDMFYILDMQTGMLLAWYKHLGRCNNCNQKRSKEEITEFIRLLKQDLQSEGGYVTE